MLQNWCYYHCHLPDLFQLSRKFLNLFPSFHVLFFLPCWRRVLQNQYIWQCFFSLSTTIKSSLHASMRVYSLSTSLLGCNALCMVNNLRVFLSSFSFSLQIPLENFIVSSLSGMFYFFRRLSLNLST